MRVVFVLTLLLSAAATLPAFVRDAARVPGAGRVGKVKIFRDEQSETDGKYVPSPSSSSPISEHEPRTVAFTSRKRGQHILQMAADMKASRLAADRQTFAHTPLAESLRIFTLREIKAWSALSNRGKVVEIVAAAHVAATWGYGTNKDKLLVLLEPVVTPLVEKAWAEFKKRIDAAGSESIRGTKGHFEELVGERPMRAPDPSPPHAHSQPSYGWFGRRATTSPGSSDGSAVDVASEASQQSVTVEQMYRHAGVARIAAADGGAWERFIALASQISRRINAGFPEGHRSPAQGGRQFRGYPFTCLSWK